MAGEPETFVETRSVLPPGGEDLPGLNVGQAFVLGAARTTIHPDPAVTERAREAYRQYRAFACSEVVDPHLLEMLLGRAKRNYVREDIGTIGHRMIESGGYVGKALNLAISRAPLLRWLEAVTGCEPLNRGFGKLAELTVESRHELDWHGDSLKGARQLAIVINLSDEAFSGGEFQMARWPDREPVVAYQHRALGSALVFRVESGLRHRVLRVTSGGPRRTFAGWFAAQNPDGEKYDGLHYEGYGRDDDDP